VTALLWLAVAVLLVIAGILLLHLADRHPKPPTAPPPPAAPVNRSYWTSPDTWCDPDCIECGGDGAPCCEPPDTPHPDLFTPVVPPDPKPTTRWEDQP